MKLNSTQRKLIEKARKVRRRAYAPNTHFRVGAAIETADGKMYTGCNIEGAAYSTTCCAERVALFTAISDGKRKFKRIAVVADTRKPCPPCGTCRQALAEFVRDMEVIMINARGTTRVMRLKELLPESFHSLK
jgi:cytidine deaminase